MRRVLLPLGLATALAGWQCPARAHEIAPLPIPRGEAARGVPATPFGFDWAVPLQAPPFSRDPQTRERQAVSRQRAVLDWTQWQSNAWHLYGPDELWLFGPPLTFAW